MSILITGAAGFIGFALAKSALDLGETVYLVDNFVRGKRDFLFTELCSRPNAIFLEGNLLDPEFCSSLPFSDVSTIYHLAAINGTKNFYEKPYEVIKANFSTLTNMLDAIPSDCCLNFLYSSSSETYAGSVELGIAPIPTPEDVPLTIADPSNLRWSYGASKLLAEVALNSFAVNGSINPYVVRFHNIYGPRMGNKHVIPNFVEKINLLAHDGSHSCELMGADQTRSFCYVDDAIRALLLFRSSSIPSGIYNIGDPRTEISISDLFVKCCQILLPDATISIVPIDAPAGSVSRRVPDISKLASIGYEPAVPLDTGLLETINWYKTFGIQS